MDVLQQHRLDMLNLFQKLDTREGAWPAPVPGVLLLRNSRSYKPVEAFYEPCMVLVAQGTKRFHFPDAVLTYNARNYLVVTVPVPAQCEGLVADDGPFLGMAVRIDLEILAELLLATPASPVTVQRPSSALTIHAPAMDAAIAESGNRLLRAMLCPAEAAALGRSLVRELHYRVLSGPAGGMLRALLTGTEYRSQIHRVLQRMHADFAAPFDVGQVARASGMSISAFHEHFRAVAGSSPLRYLKVLRLHRARSLLVQTDLSTAAAAEQVGYVSQSQFSREFKRLFGRTPLEEARSLRAKFL